MTTPDIAAILAQHAAWVRGEEGGARADLRWADLSGADLLGANLRRADMRGADLLGADLRRADLSGADLLGANLRRADMRGAYLRGADLRGANMKGAKGAFGAATTDTEPTTSDDDGETMPCSPHTGP
ncbi:MAG: pentapeptide repeat-containing protein [Methylibium sp.]|nr:pentapeptide repeat-containing protein [Methylibium sp.]